MIATLRFPGYLRALITARCLAPVPTVITVPLRPVNRVTTLLQLSSVTNAIQPLDGFPPPATAIHQAAIPAITDPVWGALDATPATIK